MTPGLTTADRQRAAQLAGRDLRAVRGEERSQKIEKECGLCGDTIRLRPSRADRRFCSRRCAGKATGGRPPKGESA